MAIPFPSFLKVKAEARNDNPSAKLIIVAASIIAEANGITDEEAYNEIRKEASKV